MNFTCEGLGNRLSWTVNSYDITDDIMLERDISIYTSMNNISNDTTFISSVLSVRGLPNNNNIVFGCHINNASNIIDSGNARLAVRGKQIYKFVVKKCTH